MKKVITILALLLTTGVCFAHYVTAGCFSKGRFTFFASQFPVGKKCTIKIMGEGNSWDTSFTVKSSSFTFTIPQLSASQLRRIKVETSDGWDGTYWTNNSVCSTLPLTFKDFRVEKIDNNTVKASVTVEDVESVQEIRITSSIDGKEFTLRAVILPENIGTSKTYSAIIKLNK